MPCIGARNIFTGWSQFVWPNAILGGDPSPRVCIFTWLYETYCGWFLYLYVPVLYFSENVTHFVGCVRMAFI